MIINGMEGGKLQDKALQLQVDDLTMKLSRKDDDLVRKEVRIEDLTEQIRQLKKDLQDQEEITSQKGMARQEDEVIARQLERANGKLREQAVRLESLEQQLAETQLAKDQVSSNAEMWEHEMERLRKQKREAEVAKRKVEEEKSSELRSLEDRLWESQRKAERLQKNMEAKENDEVQLRNEVANKDREYENSKRKVRELEQEVQDLMLQIELKDSNLQQLQSLRKQELDKLAAMDQPDAAREHQMEDLFQQLCAAQQERTQADTENRKLQEKLTLTQEQMAGLEKALKKQSKESVQVHTPRQSDRDSDQFAIQDIKIEVQSKTEEISNLREQLRLKTRELAVQGPLVAELEADLQSSKEDLTHIREQLRAKTKECIGLHPRIADLENDVQSQNHELEHLRGQIKSRTQECVLLREEVSLLEGRLLDHEKEAAERTRAMEATFKQQQQRMQAELQKDAQDVAKTTQLKLESEVQKLVMELGLQEGLTNQYKADAERLSSSVTAIEKTVTTLEEELREAQIECKEKEIEIKNRNGEVQKLKAKLEEGKEAVQEKNAEIEGLKIEIQQKAADIAQLRTLLAEGEEELQQQVAEQRKRLAETEQELQRVAEQSLQEVTNQVALREKAQRHSQQIEGQLQQHASEMEVRLEQFEQEVRGLNLKLEAKQLEITRLQETKMELKNMASEKEAYDSEQRSVQLKLNHMKTQLGVKIKDCSTLRGQIDKLTQALKGAESERQTLGQELKKERQKLVEHTRALHDLRLERDEKSYKVEELEAQVVRLRKVGDRSGASEMRIKELEEAAAQTRYELKQKSLALHDAQQQGRIAASQEREAAATEIRELQRQLERSRVESGSSKELLTAIEKAEAEKAVLNQKLMVAQSSVSELTDQVRFARARERDGANAEITALRQRLAIAEQNQSASTGLMEKKNQDLERQVSVMKAEMDKLRQQLKLEGQRGKESGSSNANALNLAKQQYELERQKVADLTLKLRKTSDEVALMRGQAKNAGSAQVELQRCKVDLQSYTRALRQAEDALASEKRVRERESKELQVMRREVDRLNRLTTDLETRSHIYERTAAATRTDLARTDRTLSGRGSSSGSVNRDMFRTTNSLPNSPKPPGRTARGQLSVESVREMQDAISHNTIRKMQQWEDADRQRRSHAPGGSPQQQLEEEALIAQRGATVGYSAADRRRKTMVAAQLGARDSNHFNY